MNQNQTQEERGSSDPESLRFTAVCFACRAVEVIPYLAQRCACGGTMRAGKKEIRRVVRITIAKRRLSSDPDNLIDGQITKV